MVATFHNMSESVVACCGKKFGVRATFCNMRDIVVVWQNFSVLALISMYQIYFKLILLRLPLTACV